MKSELIDDREITAAAEDKLAHGHVVEELALLARSAPTPSNIVLYGPWGSGKSSIAQLLRQKLTGDGGVRFVRFDAFKYAEHPLRRNFILAVAEQLHKGKGIARYRDQLYVGRTSSAVKMPAKELFKLVGYFVLVVFVLTGVLAGIVAILAVIREGDWWENFRALFGPVIGAGVLPAALLAAFVSLGGKAFQVDRKSERPDSAEQFEELFRTVVADSKAERVVIFVDELDRCRPGDVVGTLDSIRTFFGIERCVFIVAADRNVLEQALTTAVLQTTPTDEVNPYYSTGSAYLDKVFQYQLSLPPLLPQRIDRFARDLVVDRPGVWETVPNLDFVLDVLIPSHVTSPRRVKHLLNTFALTYRLAVEKHRAGLLTDDPDACAEQIARLVCLQVEFPAFARYLEQEPDLPAQVVAIDQADEVDWNDFSVSARRIFDEKTTAVRLDTRSSDEDPGDRDEVRSVHYRQLINYLRRTGSVPGPSRDLIYLQTSGTTYGLDGVVARQIELAAEDLDIEKLTELITGLPEEQHADAVAVLTAKCRTDSLTGTNAAAAMFRLAADGKVPLQSGVADSIALAMCDLVVRGRDVLMDKTIGGGWALSRLGSSAATAELRGRILTAAAAKARSWGTATDFLIADAAVAMTVDLEALGRLVAARLTMAPRRNETSPVQTLFSLDKDTLAALLSESGVAEKITVAFAAAYAQQAKEDDGTAVPPAPALGGEGPRPPFDPASTLTAIADAARGQETEVQHAILELLLSIDTAEAVAAAQTVLGATEKVTSSPLARRLLELALNGENGDPQEWLPWLRGIDAAAITDEHAAVLLEILEWLWPEPDEVLDPAVDAAALTELERLAAGLSDEQRPRLSAKARAELENSWVHHDADATHRFAVLEFLDVAAGHEFITATEVAELVAGTLEDTLAERLAVGQVAVVTSPLYRYVVEAGAPALAQAAGTLERIEGLLRQAADCTWLDSVGRVTVPLILAEAIGAEKVSPEWLSPTDDVLLLVENATSPTDQVAEIAGRWAAVARPPVVEFREVFDALRAREAVTDAFANRAAERAWQPADHHELMAAYLQFDQDPNVVELRALGIGGVDPELLTKMFAAATNNTQRGQVVNWWRAAEITDLQARRTLIETIAAPLLDMWQANKAAGDLGLDALDFVGPPLPFGTKIMIEKKLKDLSAGAEEKQASRARKLMERLEMQPRHRRRSLFSGLLP